MVTTFRLTTLLSAIGALALAGTSCHNRKGGVACTTDGDCGGTSACVYKVADGCTAKPTCQ